MLMHVFFSDGTMACGLFLGVPLLEVVMDCALDLEAHFHGHRHVIAAQVSRGDEVITTWTRTVVAAHCYSE